MPITIQKIKLVGSTDGRSIGISNTQGLTPIAVHNSTSGTTIIDEVFIYAQNNYSQACEVIFEWGVSSTNTQLIAIVPSRDGPSLVIPGLLIYGSAACQTITAFVALNGSGSLVNTSTAPNLSLTGYANRITQT